MALLALFGCSAPEPEPEHPQRIILIVADTLRRDAVSPYFSGRATPNVARLADAGQVFTNALASFHMTTMSMSAMFTGRTPSIEVGEGGRTLPWTSESWCGMARFAGDGEKSCLPAGLGTLAEDLRAARYETLAVVSNRLLFRPSGFERGFDTWLEIGGSGPLTAEGSLLHAGERVNAATVDVLAERKTDRFLLYVHFIDPHDYYIRPDLSDYASGVRYFDRVLGELLDHLLEEGLLEHALIVFTSDHGEYLGSKHPQRTGRRHFGNPSYGAVLRIPFIVAPPTHFDSTKLIRSQDVRGIVRELVGLPSLPAADIDPDELLLSEAYYQTYRRGRWKSMRNRRLGTTMLHDLKHDPYERHDVAGEHPEIVADHHERVNALTRRLGTRNAIDSELSADDEERLRALGYLE